MPPPATPRVFTRISEIRHLSTEEANRNWPVLVRAVVTYISPERYLAFIQDDSGGIYMDKFPAESHALREGDDVEITGLTGMGKFAPIVTLKSFKLLGHTDTMAANPVSFEQLISGLEDSQRVSIRGIVRSANEDGKFLTLTIAMGRSNRVRAVVRDYRDTRLGDLVDSTVCVRGVTLSHFNQRRQLTGVSLEVIGLADVKVERAPAVAPFNLPIRPIGSLMNFTREVGQWEHLVRVQGTVIHQRPGHGLFIADHDERMYVESEGTAALMPGDRVDVAGFASMGDYTPSLQAAIFRKLGTGRPPDPVRVAADNVLSGELDKALIQTDATLVAIATHADRQAMALTADNVTFNAFYELKDPADPGVSGLVPGSRLRLTGISTVVTGHPGGDPIGFDLLVRSAADVATLSRPSWWNFARLISVLGTMAGGILAALSWILILRRRVRAQTEMIRQKLVSESSLEKRYRDLFSSATDMIYAHDLTGNISSFNGGAEKITGYTRGEAVRMSIIDFVKAEQRDSMTNWLAQLNSESPVLKFEMQIVTRSGRPATIEVSASILHGEDGVEGVECIARDVSERNRIALLERDRNEVLESLGKNEPLGLVLARLTRMVERQRLGPICCVMLVKRDELQIGAAPQLAEDFRRLLQGLPVGPLSLSCGAAAYANKLIVTSNISSDPRWNQYREAAISFGLWACWSSPIVSAQGVVLGTVASYQPVPGAPDNEDVEMLEAACRLAGLAIEHSQLYNQLSYQSQHDVLTGLPNRSLFEDRLGQALASARRSQIPMVVMYLDLDHFKQVNDTLGHKCGDALLQQVVGRLKASLRETDTLARIGGDEFTLIVPDVELRDRAAQVAGRLLSDLATDFLIGSNIVSISASIGISLYPDDGEDPDTLQQKADLAMYHAKRRGKNQFQWYSAAITEQPEPVSAIEPIVHNPMVDSPLEISLQLTAG